MADKPKLSILIPVRNEGINLRIMLRILQVATDASREILIVYDEDGDDSIAVAGEFQGKVPPVRLVRNRIGVGVCNAIKAGVEAAEGDYVLIFAADEVGPVMAIDDMVHLMDRGCDLVSCTRYARGGRRLGGSLIGGLLSRSANALFQRMSGTVLSDATTGIKMFRRSLLERFQLEAEPRGWAAAFELAIKTQLAGLQMGEVPIISIDRLYGGESTFRLGPWLVEYAKWFFWGMRALWGSKLPPRPIMVVEGGELR